jgi:GNAT superfamily N-acetyltransferase
VSVTFHPATFASLSQARSRHRETLVAPQDAYWETGIVAAAAHHQIFVDGRPAGYCATDSDSYLVQFFLEEELCPRAGEVLATALDALALKGAYAATNEPGYLSLCLDRQREVAVDTLLYFDHHLVPPAGAERLRLATNEDLPRLVAIQDADVGGDLALMEQGFGSLEGYLRGMIGDGGLYVLEEGGTIIGSGDFRRRETWPAMADLGVVVAPGQQGRGIGTEILCLLKEMAAETGLEPMCSTTVENLASQRMIEKAGMVARHRILRITF